MTIPFFPVPFSLQVLFVILSGIVLGPKYGLLSQLIYIFLGIIGFPVFAGGVGGLGIIFAPTLGYVIGFPLAAFVVGSLAHNLKNFHYIRVFLATLPGLPAIYVPGVSYLWFSTNHILGKDIDLLTALKVGVIVFIIPDIIKCLIAAWFGIEIRKRLSPILPKASTSQLNPPAKELSNNYREPQK